MLMGAAAAIIGAPNLRPIANINGTSSRGFQCSDDVKFQSTMTLGLGISGVTANLILMMLILVNNKLRLWSHGVLFHQGMVDGLRAAILLPMGWSILYCEPIRICNLLETAFLLLVTVSTINMLTIVLNDSPVFPEDGGTDEDIISGPLMMDSPHCVMFGVFMIWFASITIHLGPTLLSGGLAARTEMVRKVPSCVLVYGPYRHYILNLLWISINLISLSLTAFHLRKLHRDLTKANVEAVKVAELVTTLVNVTGSSNPKRSSASSGPLHHSDTMQPPQQNGKITGSGALEEHRRMRNYLMRVEKEGVEKVKMFTIITVAYIIFWGPLFFVTLAKYQISSDSKESEITLNVAHMHAFINPVMFMVLHRGLRSAIIQIACCCCCCFINNPPIDNNDRSIDQSTPGQSSCTTNHDYSIEVPQDDLLVPPPPPPVHQSPINNNVQFNVTHRRNSTPNRSFHEDQKVHRHHSHSDKGRRIHSDKRPKSGEVKIEQLASTAVPILPCQRIYNTDANNIIRKPLFLEYHQLQDFASTSTDLDASSAMIMNNMMNTTCQRHPDRPTSYNVDRWYFTERREVPEQPPLYHIGDSQHLLINC